MNELQANSHIAYIIPSAIGFALGAATLGWQRLSHLGAISITYWVLFATYIIRPLITYVIEQDFSQIQHLSDHYCDTTTPLATHFTTGFVVSCYILAFTITAARLQKPPSKQTPSTTRLSMASMKNAHIAAALLISTGYLVLLFGRVSAGTLTRTTGGAVWSGTTGYLFMLSHLVSLGSLLLIRTRRRFLLAGAVATPYLITLFASGYNRMFFMTYALAAIVLLLDLKLQQKAASNNRGSWASRLGRLPWLRLGLTAFTILIVFNMLGRSRGSLRSIDSAKSSAIAVLNQSLGSNLSGVSGYEGTLLTVRNHVERREAPLYGADLFYHSFIMPIPRIFWAEKPVSANFHWKTLTSGTNTGSELTPEQSIFYIWLVRGHIGQAVHSWGLILFFANAVLTAAFCSAIDNARHFALRRSAYLDVLIAVCTAYCIMLGRATPYELLPILGYVFVAPCFALGAILPSKQAIAAIDLRPVGRIPVLSVS